MSSPSSPSFFKPLALWSVCCLALTFDLEAQTWTGVNLGDWNTASNWNTNAVPTGANSANIGNGTTVWVSSLAPTITSGITVTNAGSGVSLRTGGDLTASQIIIRTGANTSSIAGGNFSLTGNFNLGTDATASLMAVSSGSAQLNAAVHIGSTSTATTTARGTLNVSGGTVSQLSTANSINIGRGNASEGSLNITGGTVALSNTTTTNYGQMARIGGEGGTGVINQSAGSLTSAGGMVFGFNTNSGTTGVNGGSGTLNLSGGSFSTSGNLMLGNNTGTSGTIAFSGGSFTANNILNGAGAARIGITGNAGGSSFSATSLVLTSGATLAFTIDKAVGVTPIQITGAGTAAAIASLTGVYFEFNGVGAFTAADIGQTFNLMRWTNGMMGVTGAAFGNLGSTTFGNLQVVSDGGTGSFLQATLTAIPEPSSYAAIVGTLVGVLAVTRRRFTRL